MKLRVLEDHGEPKEDDRSELDESNRVGGWKMEQQLPCQDQLKQEGDVHPEEESALRVVVTSPVASGPQIRSHQRDDF